MTKFYAAFLLTQLFVALAVGKLPNYVFTYPHDG